MVVQVGVADIALTNYSPQAKLVSFFPRLWLLVLAFFLNSMFLVHSLLFQWKRRALLRCFLTMIGYLVIIADLLRINTSL